MSVGLDKALANDSSSMENCEAEIAKISKLATQVMKLAHDEILMHLRFLDMALAGMNYVEMPWKAQNTTTDKYREMQTDGITIQYDPHYVLSKYKCNEHLVAREYLHIYLHCIFLHNYKYDLLDTKMWDLACDIAVEAVIIDMGLNAVELPDDDERIRKLSVLKEDAGGCTAEKLYNYFRKNFISEGEEKELKALFYRDSHALWKKGDELQISMKQWEKISERINVELKAFTKNKSVAESIIKNIDEANKDKYNYTEILQKFIVLSEDITINDDEFDYIYYNYGIENYGNMPLIEPLEYKEEKRVKEFVIAIDTSASCRGSIVRGFLQKTYSILKASENFFNKVNIHIIQCDNQVQNDTKVTNKEEFDNFIKYGKLTGFGGTDFRPVFEYVEELIDNKEFENLKGMIYFTDGYGIYPEKMPKYDVIFAFLNEDENRGSVPPWSMKLILEEEEFEENNM